MRTISTRNHQSPLLINEKHVENKDLSNVLTGPSNKNFSFAKNQNSLEQSK